MGKNTISIDGGKLKARIDRLGLNIYRMPIEHGFTKNVIANAIKVGKASPVVINILSSYGIFREDYELKEDEPKFVINHSTGKDNDPIFGMTCGELKALVKEAIFEAFDGATITRG